MTKRWLSIEGFYPVHALQTNEGSLNPAAARDFTEDELSDIRRVQSEWFAWQVKIAERFGFSEDDAAKYEIVDR